ncbi:unnamed protein product [Orchesella dallaii]|uniref:Kynurenine formamidase n=1 Tax=Orchesella dallaii TaxID=48710 RepID=A0ABP1R9J7_9HEXA
MLRVCSSSGLWAPLVLLFLPALTLSEFFTAGGSGAGHAEESEWFDLSYPIDEDTIFYPGQKYEGFELSKDVQGFNQTATGNYPFWYAQYSFCMGEHGGTHVDAPFHFNKLGWKLNEIPLKRLVDVPAAVIDVETDVFALRNPDEFALEIKHIMEHEAKYGQIPFNSVVLVRTGWARYWPNKQRYLGWNNSTGHSPTMHFPGLSGPAADWLVRERHIVGLGIDSPSPDLGNAAANQVVHIITLGSQVYIIENVAYLDVLLKKTRKQPQFGGVAHSNCNLRLFVLPMKTGGTGAPARILAHCKPNVVDSHPHGAVGSTPTHFSQY